MSSVIRREIPCAYRVWLSISRSPRTDTQKVWTCWQPAPSARRATARLFGPQSARSRRLARSGNTFSYALHANVGVWLPSYLSDRAVGVGCGYDASAGWRTIVVAAVIQGQVGLETSNNIIEKGLALRPRQSGSVVASTGY